MNPSWTWAAGSAISTAEDLRIWAKAFATGQLISPAMQRERLTWVPIAEGAGYGLGIFRVGDLIGHNGEIPGFQSFMVYSPKRDVTIIVLTTLDEAPAGTAPADDLARIIITALAR